MLQKITRISLLTLLVGLPAASFAQVKGPSAIVTIGSERFTVPSTQAGNGDYLIGSAAAPVVITGGTGDTVSFYAVGTDPSIFYNFTSVDVGGANNFGLMWTNNIGLPFTGVGTVFNTYNGGITDVGTNNSSFAPFTHTGIGSIGAGFAQVGTLGPTWVGMGYDTGNLPVTGVISGTGPIGNTNGGTFTSNATLTTMRLDLDYFSSGGGDVTALTGTLRIKPTAVPEPGSVAMLAGMGLSGAIFLRRRRK